MRLIPLLVFWCLWFLNFSTRTVFAPILPLIEDNLSLSHGEAGGLLISLSIGYSIALLVAGRFAPVWGYKKTVAIGFVSCGLVLFGLQRAESYIAFHILFILLGLATGTYFPSVFPIITETYSQKHWGKVLGFHDTAASFSIFSVPILVTFALQFVTWRGLFLLLGIASLFLPIYFWKVSIEPKQDRLSQGSQYIDLFKKKTIWIMGLLYIFAVSASVGVYSILPLYLVKERGMELNFANTLFGISRVGGIPASVFAGFLADQYGYRKMLVISLLTTGISTIILSFSSTLSLITIALILQATLSTGFFAVALATISKLTPLSERSKAIGGIVSIGMVFGMGVVPFLLGVIADNSSFQRGILCLGIVTTLSPLAVALLGEK